MRPDIRIATVADAADLAAIRAQCFDKAWKAESFAEMLSNPDVLCLLIPKIAYALAQKIPPESEIITIAVIPTHRRQGIAKNLLKKLWKFLCQQDIHTMHLEVSEKLMPARALYEKMGFQSTGRRANYYGQNEDAILMCLKTAL